jgi:ketosteroid isomerase-like protein
MTLLATTVLAAGSVLAQDAADDQAAVWAAVEAIWLAEARADNDDVDAMLTDDFMGWNSNAPTPRSKSSSRMWRKFAQEREKAVQHELFPLSIVVHGDMAVAHYLYSNAVQDSDEKVVVSNGRFTDVLVRDSGTWKFISWHGGDDPSD